MMSHACHFIVAAVMFQTTGGLFIALKTVSSLQTEGNSYIACRASTTFVIRTAYYITTGLTGNACPDNCSRVADGLTSDCIFSNGTCRQPMSLDDLLTLYRKCSRLQNGSCEVSPSQIKRPFEMTYYCLDDVVTVDPCSEVRRSGPSVSLLVDYSQHANASNLSCACTVVSSKLTTVMAMNLFDPNKEEAGAEVAIGSLGERWTVGRKSLPVALHLTAPNVTDVNSSVTLDIAGPNDVTFGRTWLGLQGAWLEVECNYTSQPKPVSEFSNSDSGKHRVSFSPDPENCCLAYISGGMVVAGCVTATLIVVGVAKAWGHKRARTRKVCAFLPPEEQIREHANDVSNDGGDYCQIGDTLYALRGRSSAPMPKAISMGVDQCHLETERTGNPNSVYANEYEGEAPLSTQSRLESIPPSNRSRLASYPPSCQSRLASDPPSSQSRLASYPPSSQPRIVSCPSDSKEKNDGGEDRQASNGMPTHSREPASQDDTYGNLRRSPAKWRAAEAVIYDHASTVEINNYNGDGDVYDQLQRGPARVLVIDNIYDTTS